MILPHPIPPSPVTPPALLPHYLNYDYIIHNLGLHHCLESSAYIFQSEGLILVLRSFPCPWHIRWHQREPALYYVIFVSHAQHHGRKAENRYKLSIVFILTWCCTCGWLSKSKQKIFLEKSSCVLVEEFSTNKCASEKNKP